MTAAESLWLHEGEQKRLSYLFAFSSDNSVSSNSIVSLIKVSYTLDLIAKFTSTSMCICWKGTGYETIKEEKKSYTHKKIDIIVIECIFLIQNSAQWDWFSVQWSSLSKMTANSVHHLEQLNNHFQTYSVTC